MRALVLGVSLLIAAVAWLLTKRPWVLPLELSEPGITGRRVSQGDLFGNYYPARGPGLHAAVLMLGGSEGGLGRDATRDALALQQEGVTVLHISFFRAPGQPKSLELIPLETFGHALDWLARQPDVDAARLGMIGMSKGSEAVLLMASRRDDLRVVVAGAPSAVVWPGVDWERMGGLKASSWSLGAIPLPALPYGTFSWRSGMRSIYVNGLTNLTSHPDAVIPIERSRARILLVCGGRDQIWPSCAMAQQIKARAQTRGGPTVTILEYPNADHGVFGSPGGTSRRFGFSAKAEGNAAARLDGWPRVVAFLKTGLM